MSSFSLTSSGERRRHLLDSLRHALVIADHLKIPILEFFFESHCRLLPGDSIYRLCGLHVFSVVVGPSLPEFRRAHAVIAALRLNEHRIEPNAQLGPFSSPAHFLILPSTPGGTSSFAPGGEIRAKRTSLASMACAARVSPLSRKASLMAGFRVFGALIRDGTKPFHHCLFRKSQPWQLVGNQDDRCLYGGCSLGLIFWLIGDPVPSP